MIDYPVRIALEVSGCPLETVEDVCEAVDALLEGIKISSGEGVPEYSQIDMVTFLPYRGVLFETQEHANEPGWLLMTTPALKLLFWGEENLRQ